MLKELGLVPHWVLRSPRGEDHDRATTPAEVPSAQPAAAPRTDASDASAMAREARIAGMDWAQLKAAVRDCTACPLHSGRTQTVFGVGDEAADWLFIGEGPG